MCARNGAEHGDQYDQDGAGGQRVAEQGQRIVSGRELGAHDAGADHRGEQQR